MKEVGSTTVENIIWLPVLLLVLGAIIQFGLYFNARTAVQSAAYEAARQAALDENPCERAQQVAYSFAGGVLPGWHKDERVNVSVLSNSQVEPGDEIKVIVSYEVPAFFTGFFSMDNRDNDWLSVVGSSTTTVEEMP